MMPKQLLALVVGLSLSIASLSACAPGPRTSHYTVGMCAASGAAYVPAGVSGGTTPTVHYREQGGIVTKTLLTMLIILGAAPATETTVTSSERAVAGGTLVTTTTTTRVTDSPEQIAAKAEQASRMLDSLNTSAIPFEFTYTLVTSGLGGDTTGQMTSFMYSSSPSSSGTRWLAGMGWGSLSFSGRTRTRLRKQGDMLVSEELVEDHKYSYFGFPVRIETSLSESLMSYIQADLNLRAYFGDEEISPLHFGVKKRLGLFIVGGNLAVSRFSRGGVTGTLELSLGI